MLRKLQNVTKKLIAGRQFYKCANGPKYNGKGLIGYNCPLWKSEYHKGSFDESGYEIDHIVEHCLTGDDSENNLQALCISCHRVKTRRFMHSRFKK